MNSKKNILQYGLCIICNRNLAKLGSNKCKKCKPKRNRIKDEDSCKIYYYKFHDKYTKSKLRLNSSKADTKYSLCIEPSSLLTRRSGAIKNSDLFVLPTWNQFRSLKEFTSCIIQSDQFSISFFVISCSTFVQGLPKFQYFIKSKIIDLPPENLSHIIALPFPLTRPLQLLCQPSFWDDLLILYFKEFHPMSPLFSIQSFNRKTASPTLLSAMYYCAYHLSKKHSNEITEYMNKLADQNIKKVVKNASIDNIRALIIHTNLAQWGGNPALANNLQAHINRMSYLLGLHLNYSKLSQAERYNRDVLYCMARMRSVCLTGSHNFCPSYISGYRKSDLYLYDTKWQLPGPSSIIYSDNHQENLLYSHCSSIFFKFANISFNTVWVSLLSNLKADKFNETWTYKLKKLKDLYENTMQALDDLKEKYYVFKSNVTFFEINVKMSYHEAVIDMYETLKHKNMMLQPGEISIMLDHCHELYNVLSTAESYNHYFQFFAQVIGLHYLNIYSKCSPSEKQTIKQRLLDLILFMKDKFLKHFSLNYLVLKTGYDLLNEN